MSKREQTTKNRIVSAAWKLFYEQGYENTTVEEIIDESGTSKGSFYHYFVGKDALLGSLSLLFDEQYAELMETLDPATDSFEKLMYLNRELFAMVESRIPLELLATLLSSQIVTKGERHLLDRNRLYFRLLRRIAQEGQERGELTRAVSPPEIVKLYALCERSLLYDWCLCNGEYSLRDYAARTLPLLLGGLKA